MRFRLYYHFRKFTIPQFNLWLISRCYGEMCIRACFFKYPLLFLIVNCSTFTPKFLLIVFIAVVTGNFTCVYFVSCVDLIWFRWFPRNYSSLIRVWTWLRYFCPHFLELFLMQSTKKRLHFIALLISIYISNTHIYLAIIMHLKKSTCFLNYPTSLNIIVKWRFEGFV